jgi:hypothetical protein
MWPPRRDEAPDLRVETGVGEPLQREQRQTGTAPAQLEIVELGLWQVLEKAKNHLVPDFGKMKPQVAPSSRAPNSH